MNLTSTPITSGSRRIHTCEENWVSQVNGEIKNEILLEMVQLLTDLDLLISKSYVSTDATWFMNVFHVTDQNRNKLTDESLKSYIQETLCANKRVKPRREPSRIMDQCRSRYTRTA
ncbi:hypothetical protein SAY87_026311 [Trapa incisa]|uniref:ACT domain-containing protein ACR n=1 Tax=Trapa incisa TaxID=236973 RepID=A0AAN7GRS7_9MYRT|nr:hypothetical protein SAY87_026311 [Trapa incisa]